MRLLTKTTFALAALLGVANAEQQHVAPVRAYEPITVALAEPRTDTDLDAFRQQLGKVAKDRIYVDLARLVTEHDFFWGRDFGKRYDPRKPGVDNLAAALRLEHNNGFGWTTLERLAGEDRAAPLASHPNVVCAPAPPRFDAIALDRLIDLTRTAASDWAYTRAPDVAIRAQPRIDAAAFEILGLQFVRVLGQPGPDHGGWTQVVAPSGAVGFVAPDALRSLTAPQLCYGKDLTGHWQIAGYIDRGD